MSSLSRIIVNVSHSNEIDQLMITLPSHLASDHCNQLVVDVIDVPSMNKLVNFKIGVRGLTFNAGVRELTVEHVGKRDAAGWAKLIISAINDDETISTNDNMFLSLIANSDRSILVRDIDAFSKEALAEGDVVSVKEMRVAIANNKIGGKNFDTHAIHNIVYFMRSMVLSNRDKEMAKEVAAVLMFTNSIRLTKFTFDEPDCTGLNWKFG